MKISKGPTGFKKVNDHYLVNMAVVRVVSAIILAYMVFAILTITSHERYYILNDNPGEVGNPFYGSTNKHLPTSLTTMEYLPPGYEAGYNHKWYITSAPVFALILLGLAGFYNHYKYNREV